MTRLTRLATSSLAAVALSALLVGSPIFAQAAPRGFDPDIMMGPGMMGPRMMMGRGMCDPRVAGLAEWRIERIERAVRPTDAQRPALNELKAASKKAAEIIATACPRELPEVPTARLELMEKRLDAMLQGVKTVRPAFDAFYAILTDDQKAAFTKTGPRRWGWRGWRDR